MQSKDIQVGNLTYNPATRSFEALVTINGDDDVTRFPVQPAHAAAFGHGQGRRSDGATRRSAVKPE